jgi:hypothetical protein
VSAVAATTGRARRNSRTAASAHPWAPIVFDNATSTDFNLLPQRIVTFMHHASPATSTKILEVLGGFLRSVNIIVTARRNVSSRSSSLGSSRASLKIFVTLMCSLPLMGFFNDNWRPRETPKPKRITGSSPIRLNFPVDFQGQLWIMSAVVGDLITDYGPCLSRRDKD